MKKLCLVGVLFAASSPLAHAQFYDDFDAYNVGALSPQSLWEEWTAGSGADLDVTAAQSFTTPHSALLQAGDDVVYDFANLAGGRPTTGNWICTVHTYIPSSATGVGFVNLLNDYPSANWSFQIKFDATNGKVKNGGGSEELPLLTDRWVALYVCIELEKDRASVFYGPDILIHSQSWRNGWSGGGQSTIAVLELYGTSPAKGIDEMYIDDCRLENMFGPCTRLDSTPNPLYSGDKLSLRVDCPNLNPGTRGALFTWAVNGTSFKMRLLGFKLGAGRNWVQSFNIPSGLTGFEVGLKAFVLPRVDPIALSNESLLLFR